MSISIVYVPITGGGVVIGTYPDMTAALDAAKDGPYYSVAEDDGECLDYCRLGWSSLNEYVASWEGISTFWGRYFPDEDGRDCSDDPLVLTQCAGWPFTPYSAEMGVGLCVREGTKLCRSIMTAITAPQAVA